MEGLGEESGEIFGKKKFASDNANKMEERTGSEKYVNMSECSLTGAVCASPLNLSQSRRDGH